MNYVSKNSENGLRFRIQETLSRSVNKTTGMLVPLTAREIATQLHSSDYKDMLFDTLLGKVVHSLHAMKSKGKVITDLNLGPANQLMWLLPQRLKFPAAAPTAAPANPVLTAELAAKVQTVDPAEPKKQHTTGAWERIVEYVNQASEPVISREVMAALGGELYPDDVGDLKVMRVHFTDALRHLHARGRIERRRALKRGKGVKWEYFPKRLIAAAPEPKAAPAPAAAAAPVSTTPPKISDQVYALLLQQPEPLPIKEFALIARQAGVYAGVPKKRAIDNVAGMVAYLVKQGCAVADGSTPRRYRALKTGGMPQLAAAPPPLPIKSTTRTVEAPVANAPLPAPAEKPALFRPVAKVEKDEVLSCRVTAAYAERVRQAAARYEVDVSNLIIQALDFALEHAE